MGEIQKISDSNLVPDDFKDSIPSSKMQNRQRYRVINNEDGTISLEDVTDYEQVGDEFGATQVNRMARAINSKLEQSDVVDPALATQEGFAADAKLTGEALSELNSKMLPFPKYNAFKPVISLNTADSNALRYSSWTADEDCFVYACASSDATVESVFLRLYINGVVMCAQHTVERNYTYLFTGLYPIKAGTTCRIDAATLNNAQLIKIPFDL